MHCCTIQVWFCVGEGTLMLALWKGRHNMLNEWESWSLKYGQKENTTTSGPP